MSLIHFQKTFVGLKVNNISLLYWILTILLDMPKAKHAKTPSPTVVPPPKLSIQQLQSMSNTAYSDRVIERGSPRFSSPIKENQTTVEPTPEVTKKLSKYRQARLANP